MVLQLLDFNECVTDSPYFRERIHAYEKEIEKSNKAIKRLIKECGDLLTAASKLSKAQRGFSKLLAEFEFDSINSEKTNEELEIEKSLKEFGTLITTIEEARDLMLEKVQNAVIIPLQNFRKDGFGEAKKRKQMFDTKSGKFYQLQERYLSARPSKSTETEVSDDDAAFEIERQNFFGESMNYFFMLQEVQERKKFEFVELLLQFMFSWLTFYHEGYEVCNDFQPYMKDLGSKLQKCRANFESTKIELEFLKKDWLEKSMCFQSVNVLAAHMGFLTRIEKKGLLGKDPKYHCVFNKKTAELALRPSKDVNSRDSNSVPSSVPKEIMTVISWSLNKEKKIDIVLKEKPQSVRFEAGSDKELRSWLDAMGDQASASLDLPSEASDVVKTLISAIETKGLEEEGLYRTEGVKSEIQKVLDMWKVSDKNTIDKASLVSNPRWDIKVLTSSLKTYFRDLFEPLLTFKLRHEFISVVAPEGGILEKVEDKAVNRIHELVYQLPKANFQLLDVLIGHLTRVVKFKEKNKMDSSNLGVCFGPTLLSSSVADMKAANQVVAILIENYEKIFQTLPGPGNISRGLVDPRPLVPPQPVHKFSATPGTQPNASPGQLQLLSSSTGKIANASTVPSSKREAPTTPHLRAKEIIGMNPASSTPQATLLSSSTPNVVVPSSVAHPKQQRSIHRQTYAAPQPVSTSSSTTRSYGVVDQHSSASSSSESLNFRHSNSSVSTAPSAFSTQHPVSLLKRRGRTARTLYSCIGDNDPELSFEPNELVKDVVDSKEPGWVEGTVNGKWGLIPANYIEYLQ